MNAFLKYQNPNVFVDLHTQVCGKLFASQQKLEVHKPVHSRSRKDSFSCPQCGQECTNWRAYLYHVAKHTANGGKKHVCQVCFECVCKGLCLYMCFVQVCACTLCMLKCWFHCINFKLFEFMIYYHQS